jgi:hypothetical protein
MMEIDAPAATQEPWTHERRGSCAPAIGGFPPLAPLPLALEPRPPRRENEESLEESGVHSPLQSRYSIEVRAYTRVQSAECSLQSPETRESGESREQTRDHFYPFLSGPSPRARARPTAGPHPSPLSPRRSRRGRRRRARSARAAPHTLQSPSASRQPSHF